MSRPLEELGLSIKKVQSRQHRALDAQLLQVGVSLVQWNALREIGRDPGSSAHRLPELTFNSDQDFGTLTARLLRLDFIERQPGPERSNTHCLTQSGKVMLAKGQEIMQQVLTASTAPLSYAERTMLVKILTKLLAVLWTMPILPRSVTFGGA